MVQNKPPRLHLHLGEDAEKGAGDGALFLWRYYTKCTQRWEVWMTRHDNPEALTPVAWANLFEEVDPDTYIEEMEPSFYVIDGRFDLNRLAELFLRRLNG